MSRRDEREDVTQEAEEQSQELAVMAPSLIDRFTDLMASIPEADSGEATERIVTQVLEAETPEQLDEPWSGQSIKTLVGRLLRVKEVKRLPSDYAGGPGWYLGCQCTLLETGEDKFVSVSSISCLAQIATAYTKGMLPLDVVPRQAERKSRNGYFPMHLEIAR